MIGRLLRFFAATLGRRRFENRLAGELAEHLALRADDLVASGLSRAEAERRARLELGGSVDGFKEECRSARRLVWGDEFLRNVRHAGRVLRRSPGLTLTIALTLGLGLGANVAVLSVINAVLLRPLPYPEPERLAMIQTVFGAAGQDGGTALAQDGRAWEALRDGVRKIRVAPYSGWASGANVVMGGEAQYLHQQRVGAGFFEVLGVAPALGRGFLPSEDVPGGPPVVVLSHELWRRHFASDPAVLGRTLLVRGAPYEVIGVLPQGFHTDLEADLWTPLLPSTTGEGEGTNYGIAARLPPGVSWEEARAEVAAVGAGLFANRRQDAPPARLDLLPMQEALASGLEQRLLITWVVALLVLVVGAVNVAGLLLAHGARRASEIRTRMALGGPRLAVVRQLLTETLAFAGLGGLVGLALGWIGMQLLRDAAANVLGVWQPITLDLRVLAAVCALVLATVLVTGLYPALAATRGALRPAELAGEGRVAGARNPWPRRLLVGGQLALVVTLLVGAGLVLRTLAHLRTLAPGCELRGVLAARVSLQDARYASAADAARLFDEVLADLARRPGIEGAAGGLSLPFERPLNMGFALPDDGDKPPGPRITNLTYVTASYFETLGIPVLRGRSLAPADRVGASPVAVINSAFARTYLEGKEPIGQRLSAGGTWYEVVGVVGDTVQTPSFGDPAPLAARAGVYVPVAQVSAGFLALVHTWFEPSFIVRSSLGQAAAEGELRRAIAAVDRQLPVAEVRTLTGLREQVIAAERFQAELLALAAGIALVLAAVGLAGLIAGSVAERTRELGIRMALGSSTAKTVAGAALPGLGIALGGLIAGLALALALVRALRAFVFGVGLFDPLTFVAVPLLLLTVTALASLVPALRILRLDPARTLRAP